MVTPTPGMPFFVPTTRKVVGRPKVAVEVPPAPAPVPIPAVPTIVAKPVLGGADKQIADAKCALREVYKAQADGAFNEVWGNTEAVNAADAEYAEVSDFLFKWIDSADFLGGVTAAVNVPAAAVKALQDWLRLVFGLANQVGVAEGITKAVAPQDQGTLGACADTMKATLEAVEKTLLAFYKRPREPYPYLAELPKVPAAKEVFWRRIELRVPPPLPPERGPTPTANILDRLLELAAEGYVRDGKTEYRAEDINRGVADGTITYQIANQLLANAEKAKSLEEKRRRGWEGPRSLADEDAPVGIDLARIRNVEARLVDVLAKIIRASGRRRVPAPIPVRR